MIFFWEKMFIESEIQKIIGQSSHLIPPENIRKSKISGVFTRYKMETLLRNVFKCFLFCNKSATGKTRNNIRKISHKPAAGKTRNNIRKISECHLFSWCGNFVLTQPRIARKSAGTAFPQNFHTGKLDKVSVFRSSPSQMFFKVGVLKKFAGFTGKCLCWSFFLMKCFIEV